MNENFFTQSFKDHTVVWLLISSLVGGIIGSLIKVLSESIIIQNLSKKRTAEEHFKTYSYKLLKAATGLDKRLDFIIRDGKNVFRYEDENSKLSLFHTIGQYFGWCKIIHEDAIDKFIGLPKKHSQFYIVFMTTYKALSSNVYFLNITTHEEIFESHAVIPNYCFTAISEKMLAPIDDNKTLIKSPLYNFGEFCELYKSDEKLKGWFTYFENFLDNIKFEKDNLNWNRLILFSVSLKLLIYHLDKNSSSSLPYNNLPHLNLLNESVFNTLKKDLELFKRKKIPIPQGLNYRS